MAAGNAVKLHIERALSIIERRGVVPGNDAVKRNITAYSAGVDSTLTAALAQRVFPTNSVAGIGIPSSLSDAQLCQAREVASQIGLELWETKTTEGEEAKYIENNGQRKHSESVSCNGNHKNHLALSMCSCYCCKTNLYTTINQVANHAK